jgi:C4-dicarboxylate-specific signal transduction histidine kinase
MAMIFCCKLPLIFLESEIWSKKCTKSLYDPTRPFTQHKSVLWTSLLSDRSQVVFKITSVIGATTYYNFKPIAIQTKKLLTKTMKFILNALRGLRSQLVSHEVQKSVQQVAKSVQQVGFWNESRLIAQSVISLEEWLWSHSMPLKVLFRKIRSGLGYMLGPRSYSRFRAFS